MKENVAVLWCGFYGVAFQMPGPNAFAAAEIPHLDRIRGVLAMNINDEGTSRYFMNTGELALTA